MAFNMLKNTITSLPVSAHFNADQDVIVEMDTSDYVSASILSQYNDNIILHCMACLSKTYSPTI
jgi:hypothetical protein